MCLCHNDCPVANALAYTHVTYILSRSFNPDEFDTTPPSAKVKEFLSTVDRQGNTIPHTVAREVGSLVFKPLAKCFSVHFHELLSMKNAAGQTPWDCAYVYDAEHGLPRQYPDLE